MSAKGKKKKVGSIYFPDGKVIDIVELKGQNGKRTIKMQPRRNSLMEGEKIFLGHTKENRGLNHLNGYQKIQGKIIKLNVSIKVPQYRSIPLSQEPVALLPEERILGIYGESLPSSIVVKRSEGRDIVYPSGFVSGTTIYAGSIDYFIAEL